jgi:prolyl-tRNA editing enzyme YbaK/EbsC (Cys-tRNA(Pro) deacylase)
VRECAANLPVIAITGVDQSVKVDELKALRLVALMRKPFTAEALLGALRGALDPVAGRHH